MNCFSDYVILITPRGDLWPSQPPIPWQPEFLPEGKADGVKNDSSNTFTLLYVFMAWEKTFTLITYLSHFTF